MPSSTRVGIDTFKIIGEARSSLGIPVPFATVTVTDVFAAAPAALFADEFLETPIAQPYVTDASGRYEFYVARGRYSFAFAGTDRFATTEDVVVTGPFETTTPTLTVDAITDTGIIPQDLGAVGQSGGGREKSFTDDPVSGDYQPDITRGNVAVAFVDGDVNVIPPDVADPDDSYALLIYFVQKSPGGHSYTWDPSITWLTLGGGVPSMQTAAGAGDLVSLIKLGGVGNWLGVHNTAQLQIQAAYLDWDLIAAPAAPPSGKLRTWADATTRHLTQIDSDGNVLDLTAGGGTGGGGGGGGSGVITQVPGQFDHQHTLSDSTITGTLPSAATAGNLLVAEFNTDMSGGTITPPAGWTEAIKRDSSDAIGWAGIWFKVAAGGETTAVFTLSSGSHMLEVAVAEYEGNTATPLDQTAFAELHNTTNTFNVTTGATTVDAELAVCSMLAGGGYSGGGSLGWGASGFGTLYDFGDGGAGTKPLTAMGTVTASPTLPGNNYAVGVVATFKAA